MNNDNLTPEEKEEKLKNYFDLIEEKKQISHNTLKKADLERSLQLQKETDHY